MENISLNEAKKHLSKDKIFKPLVKTLDPLYIPGSGDVFNELVKNIVYQQISYKAADAIYKRFIDLTLNDKFSPEEVLRLHHDELRSAGLSNQKAKYIINIADFFQDNNLHKHNWDELGADEILALLTQIKGVGNWTAKMILIFELQRSDVFPFEDLAIQYVIKELYQLNEEKTALVKKIIEIAEVWRPYRTFASLYLWSYRRAQS